MLSYMGRMSCMLTTSLPTLNATATATKFPKGSDENESHIKEHTAAKDGIWQWLQKFITERSAEKEKYTITDHFSGVHFEIFRSQLRSDVSIVQEISALLICAIMSLTPFGGLPAENVLFFFLTLRNNLKRYGLAGVLSYGLLNTFYYLVTFLFVWFYVAPSEGSLGFGPAAQRFVKLFSMVWAGSQVTKLFRAAGALALAPFVDRGLNWYTDRFNFKSRGKAFGFIVGACVVLAVSVFLIITTLSV
ncbi:hypothetical protein AXG93_4201s1200 [Marchantia polymorpha subsp. ruderalis]|uniref:Uncharacterized protein n=1 Tax=Marchantia polymorpha subsp. ruderalis TaxID=1480154 RepID=A0A176WB64_MARPO|nr:hypothetical protein AXG93_4201s1200 [Marchantia polymorpha subsp. ruderalis]